MRKLEKEITKKMKLCRRTVKNMGRKEGEKDMYEDEEEEKDDKENVVILQCEMKIEWQSRKNRMEKNVRIFPLGNRISDLARATIPVIIIAIT